MNIALSDGLFGMAKKRGDRQFRKAKIAGNAPESMPKRMWGHTPDLCECADAGQARLCGRELAIRDVGREDMRIIAYWG